MKFTEQEAYEELVRQMTKKGETLQASERTIKSMAKRYYNKFVDEETELADFVKDNIDDFKEFDGQARKDKADFVKQYQVQNPKPNQQEPQNNTQKTEVELLMERLQALEEGIKQSEREKAIGSKRNVLLTKMKELGIKDEEWSKTFISEINITEDFDVEAKANAYLKIYNKSNAQTPTNVTPSGGGTAPSNTDEFADIKAMREKELELKSKL